MENHKVSEANHAIDRGSPDGRPAFVTVGYVARAHGLYGELVVTPLTDEPTRFEDLSRIFVESPDGSRGKRKVHRVRFIRKGVILKLEGVDDRSSAEKMVGCYFEIPREECLDLPEDTYYEFDLLGMSVITVDGCEIGRLADVLHYPANDVYVVTRGENEVLIPAIKDVVKEVDVKNRVMTIEPMEGLLG